MKLFESNSLAKEIVVLSHVGSFYKKDYGTLADCTKIIPAICVWQGGAMLDLQYASVSERDEDLALLTDRMNGRPFKSSSRFSDVLFLDYIKPQRVMKIEWWRRRSNDDEESGLCPAIRIIKKGGGEIELQYNKGEYYARDKDFDNLIELLGG